jgi:pyruvate/2-oxoglutarate dehydrogenase complex dihydrolipoamide dehydrogenase (E3) component
LVTATDAAGPVARVTLVERLLLGGDGINVGCVPSKSILRSARMRADASQAAEFRIVVPPGNEADFAAVMEPAGHRPQ